MRITLADVVNEIAGAVVTRGPADVVVGDVRCSPVGDVSGDLVVSSAVTEIDALADARAARDAGARAFVSAFDVEVAGLSIVRVPDVRRATALGASAVHGHPAYGLDVIVMLVEDDGERAMRAVAAVLQSAGVAFESFIASGPRAQRLWRDATDTMRALRGSRERAIAHVVIALDRDAFDDGLLDAVRVHIVACTSSAAWNAWAGPIEQLGAEIVVRAGDAAACAEMILAPLGASVFK